MDSATGLPTGLKISPTTGAITGSVAVGAAATGPYTVTVLAEDGTYSASQTFTWTINSPVTIVTPADQTSNEGASVSLSISASDTTSGTLRYAAVGLPAGLAMSATTGAISGTVTAGDAVNGPYTVTRKPKRGRERPAEPMEESWLSDHNSLLSSSCSGRVRSAPGRRPAETFIA